MKHKSVSLNSPCEFIEISSINPLISKCVIKVCYVSDEPNRNGTIINRETAKKIANSLPGSPIVGYFNSNKEDFEEHNQIITISNNAITISDQTKPYGFVDVNAKVWFEKFLDDDEFEREYLVTEGYIWTGQYPESERIVMDGNNQSMKLFADSVQGEQAEEKNWSENFKNNSKFFIINDAIIENLCILGDDYEPCFEGSQITKATEYSFETFKVNMYSMVSVMKNLLAKEGGSEKVYSEKVYTEYAVEIGSSLFNSIWSYLEKKYPDPDCEYPRSLYCLEGIYEEDNQKFVIIFDSNKAYYKLNFSINEDAIVFEDELVEVSMTFTPRTTPIQKEEAVAEYLAARQKEFEKEMGKKGEKEDLENKEVIESVVEKEEKEDSVGDASETYILEEIPEYIALQEKFNSLQTEYCSLEAQLVEITQERDSLIEFKNKSDRKDKEALIQQFYMLSEEDKAEVVQNIDNYSLEEIESKLSILCFRNKVSFALDEQQEDTTVFNIYSTNNDSMSAAPDWVRAAITISENIY